MLNSLTNYPLSLVRGKQPFRGTIMPRTLCASMGYRVVESSSTFASDLPPSSRNVHPSGMLHAFGSSRSDGDRGGNNDDPGDNNVDSNAIVGGAAGEHAFAWVENALHIEAALSLLEGCGFRRSESIVFIPYSTKRNWMRRYPHAVPALECRKRGKCVVGPLAAAVKDDEGDGDGKEEEEKEKEKEIADETAANAAEKRARTKYKSRAASNIFDNKTFIPDAERDELHVEIYNYLRWLHAKVSELEERAKVAALKKRVASIIPPNDSDSDDVEGDGGDEKKRKGIGRPKGVGVNLVELQGVIDKMESAFLIIPNAKEEAAAEIMAAAEKEMGQEQQGRGRDRGDEEGASGEQRCDGEQQEVELEREEEEATSGQRSRSDDAEREQRKMQAPPEALATNRLPDIESPPFLERHCSEGLFRKVLARERSGKLRRRSRRRKRPWEENANHRTWKEEGFDEMFDKLLRYREEHGHVAVTRNKDDENNKLANWVSQVRHRRRTLLRTSGLDHEPSVPGKGSKLRNKNLTLEGIKRLDSVGFVWSLAGPKVAWEDRFQEAVEYFEEHGHWPPHTLGKLGEWVHRQRRMYAAGGANFMRDRAPKLDEVGFEWAPRGPRGRRWNSEGSMD